MRARQCRFGLQLLASLLCSCGGGQSIDIIQYGHLRSPSGDLNAYAYEYNDAENELTQVMLEFPGKCGAGAVSAYKSGLELELRWLDEENLEVIHPRGIEFERNASGEVLQCRERRVRVHLVSR